MLRPADHDRRAQAGLVGRCFRFRRKFTRYRIGDPTVVCNVNHDRVVAQSFIFQMLEQGTDGISAALTRLWQISDARLEAMTEAERTQQVQHGQKTWTARRALRRMLEHHWEHLLEIARRLGQPMD